MENNLENSTVEEVVETSNDVVADTKEQTEKTFTQEDLDKILNKKFAQWQKKTEEAKLEAERKAKLTESEKLAEERKEFEAMRKQFEYEQRVNATTKTLASSNLPIEFADFLVAENEESTAQRVELFKDAFNNALEKAINERLRGKTPKSSPSNEQSLSREQFNKMSYQEKLELFNKNKELFNALNK